MIAQNKKSRCTIFAQFFVHFQQNKNFCDIVANGEGKLRREKSEQLKSELKNLSADFEKIENQMAALENESESEKEMRRLARLIFAGKILEKSGLLYTFNEQTLFEFLTANKNNLEKPPEKKF